MKEGHDRIVKLPEVAPSVFKIWMKWLYTGRLFVKQDGDDNVDENGVTRSREWGRLRECYALGDFLQDPDFKDATIDAFIERFVETNSFPTSLAAFVYDHSNKGSMHRRLAMDVFVHVWRRQEYKDILTEDEDDWEYQPRIFLCDVLVHIGSHLENGVKEQEAREFFDLNNTCKYHDHGSDKPCYKTKPAFLA